MFLSGSILGDQHPLLRIVFAYEDYPLFMVITWLNNQTHDVSNTIFHNCIILVLKICTSVLLLGLEEFPSSSPWLLGSVTVPSYL